MTTKTASIIKNFSLHLSLLLIFLIPVFLNAQNPVPPTPTPNPIPIKIDNPFNCGGTSASGNCTVMTLILAILNNIVLPIAAVAVTMWIIWAGFQFVLAQGKPADIDKAKSNLLWSLIGAGILLGSVGIAKVVESTVRLLIVP
ncbi:MAG: hypothetical protein AB198_00725 [Parcubacteria bacterium C7867-003]|nr:MAG: hypothetical protein AB198_00725 [Parcubacteria bacterium C7867-003]